jgi:hypothetical protein
MLSFRNMKGPLLNVGLVIISFIAAFFIINGLTIIGDKYRISFINSREMVHFTIFFLFPAVAVLVFVSIRKVYTMLFLKQEYHGNLDYKISRNAIASFTLIFFGFIPLLSVGGIMCGHRALKEINSSSNIRGFALAVMGLVFNYLWFLYSIYVIYVIARVLTNY